MPIYVGNASYGKLYVGSAGGEINNEDMNVTPSESQQTITADTGYTGLGTVTVGAISSSYVGSGIDRRSSSDLTDSGATVTAPSGYYENAATKTVASGTEGTPTATKGTVSSHSISVTPSVTNTAGYISGGTHSGTAVTVSASELVSGTLSVSSSGTKDVTNYASASIPAGTVTAPATISGTSASVSTSTNTLTLSKTVSVTPNVSTAGYISSGTAGNASVSLSASVTTQAAQTIHPSTSNQTIASGRYLTGTQTINAVTLTNLTAANIKSGVVVKVGDSSDDDCVTSVTGTYTGGGGSGKNVQYSMGRSEISNTSYTATNQSITVSKAGSYKCYWVMDRNTTSGTSGSQLYKNGTAVGSAHTSWTYNNNNRYAVACEETLTLAVNDVLVVRCRSRSTSYICGASDLIIIEQ